MSNDSAEGLGDVVSRHPRIVGFGAATVFLIYWEDCRFKLWARAEVGIGAEVGHGIPGNMQLWEQGRPCIWSDSVSFITSAIHPAAHAGLGRSRDIFEGGKNSIESGVRPVAIALSLSFCRYPTLGLMKLGWNLSTRPAFVKGGLGH